MKTLVNSILYKRQNREANEGSVHYVGMEGIDVKPGLQIILAVEPLVKSQTSHRAPNELNFSDPTTSQIRGHLD